MTERNLKNYRFLLIAIASLLLAAGCNKQVANTPRVGPQPVVVTPEAPAPAQTTTQSPATIQPEPKQISLSVLGVPNNPGVKFFSAEGKNALEILQSSYTVTTKNYSGLGGFVQSINGVTPDGKHFWEFFVNGKSSTVGASSFVPKAGDAMDWKLEVIN